MPYLISSLYIIQTAPASDAENLTKAIPMIAALGLRIASPFPLNLQFCLFFFVQRRTFVFSQVSSDCCSKHSRLLPTAPHPLHLGGEHRRMPSHPLGAIHCTLAGLQG